MYLITVDHFSDFIEVDELQRNATASNVVNKCRQNFARYGTPMYVTTDGGPQFNSAEFRKLATEWEFLHTMSAPHHQQANGKAEAAVKIIKQLLKKTGETNSDFWKALQQWRNVPNNCGSSPAQRMFCRRIRFNVPMAEAKYTSHIQAGVKERIKKNRQTAKYYYDRTAKSLPPLEIGQPVFVKKKPTDNTWLPGEVKATATDRSTIVDVRGQQLRRDNVMIKRVPQAASHHSLLSGNEVTARSDNSRKPEPQLDANPTIDSSNQGTPSRPSSAPEVTSERPKRRILVP